MVQYNLEVYGSKMKSIVYPKCCQPYVLELKDVEKPPPTYPVAQAITIDNLLIKELFFTNICSSYKEYNL
jgi:hypothetical protein